SQEAFQGAWFRSGDMYTVDADGFWHHQGRADDMLKISGQWVSPGEIEDAALAHAGVKDACAVGWPDADGLPRVALLVVPPQTGANEVALAENIRAALKAHLSPYKIPKWIKPIAEIPRTATGKAQRYVLRQKYESAGRCRLASSNAGHPDRSARSCGRAVEGSCAASRWRRGDAVRRLASPPRPPAARSLHSTSREERLAPVGMT